MKNAKLKSDIESKLSAKIHEIIGELKVEGNAISKSIADASKKIAKHVVRKLKDLEKKNSITKKETPTVKKAVKKLTVTSQGVLKKTDSATIPKPISIPKPKTLMGNVNKKSSIKTTVVPAKSIEVKKAVPKKRPAVNKK